MIELPRACLVAGEIARDAEFFSFGTNDLTQTALGFSRDDIEGRIVPLYLDAADRRALAVRDDRRGRRRASSCEIAVERGRPRGRGSRPGVCGEHGGDPASIRFFHRAGLDYVSCSPFRVPVARVAAAQAAIAGRESASRPRRVATERELPVFS